MTTQTPTPLEKELLERLEKVFMEYSRNFRKSEKDTEYAKKVLPIFSSSIQAFLTELKGTLNMFQMHHWDDETEEHSNMPIHQSDFKYLKGEIDKTASKHFGSLVGDKK